MGEKKIQGLTDKQRRFVEEYLIDFNATQACIRAGYSAKTADRIGPELLGKTCVALAIREGMSKIGERTKVNQDYVKSILVRQYEINAKTYPKLDFEGNPIIGADGKPVMRQVDATAANKAADMLAKHVGFYEADNKNKLEGGLAVVWKAKE